MENVASQRDSDRTGGSCTAGCTTYYDDSDSDTFGDAGDSLAACVQPTGYVTDNQDCDDANANCDTDCTDADSDGYCVNNDCDDSVATGGSCTAGCTTYYDDSDSDTFGDAGDSLAACVQPTGYVTDNQDCDDANANFSHMPNTKTALHFLRWACFANAR